MPLVMSPYAEQASRWPRTGRGILAQFDAESVVVYQAFKPEIGQYAAEHGRFGGSFSLTRMSWVKPNFMWMMYRCGWGQKPDQETVLAVRLRRDFLEGLLRDAVPSSWDSARYATRQAWQDDVARSDVRLQWDPDHDPSGRALERRAIQLGLRGDTLRTYAQEAIVAIDDITELVASQRDAARAGDWAALHVPVEEPFPVRDPAVARRLGLDW